MIFYFWANSSSTVVLSSFKRLLSLVKCSTLIFRFSDSSCKASTFSLSIYFLSDFSWSDSLSWSNSSFYSFNSLILYSLSIIICLSSFCCSISLLICSFSFVFSVSFSSFSAASWDNNFSIFWLSSFKLLISSFNLVISLFCNSSI